MATHLWLITAKTNLHVGNESASGTGIIDNAVQRDALTDLPCIHSSSLKGAINEYCTMAAGMSEEDRLTVFGSDKRNNGSQSRKGSAKFFDAKLLCIPVQCDDVPYRLARCQANTDVILDRASLLGLNVTKEMLCPAGCVEHEWAAFKELCDDGHLPVIARNKLENGTSANLWYEQVVPAETVFCAMIDDPDEKLTDLLDGKYIQIGANASIGYGLCKFNKVQ